MSLVQKAVSYQHLYSFTSVRILVVSSLSKLCFDAMYSWHERYNER